MQRTRLEEEDEIVWETWQQRLLFKISRKYPLHKLSKVYCNSDPEYPYYCKLTLYRWVLLILPFMPVSQSRQEIYIHHRMKFLNNFHDIGD